MNFAQYTNIFFLVEMFRKDPDYYINNLNVGQYGLKMAS